MDIINKRQFYLIADTTPAWIAVASIAIISTRGVDLLLLMNLLGYQGMFDFLIRVWQTPVMTLIFISGVVLLAVEILCAISILKGSDRGRWGFVVTQIIVATYLWFTSIGYGYLEIFSLPGESYSEILRSLVLQKLPDLLVIFLLFVPLQSRLFFRHH